MVGTLQASFQEAVITSNDKRNSYKVFKLNSEGVIL